MGTTLRDPDFVTTRGPLIEAIDGFSIGEPVPYTMGPDLQSHYPTDGSPRTWNNVCIVAASEVDNFLCSILPDVYEDTFNQDTTQLLTMTPYGESNIVAYWRNPLIRLDPQRHPRHPRAFVVDAQVMGGLGYPFRNSSNELTFRTKGVPPPPDDEEEGEEGGSEIVAVDGYVKVGVTWRDLPYEIVFTGGDPNVNIANTLMNAPGLSEIERYCLFKPAIKGSNLQVKGNVFFIDDNGQIIRNDATPGNNGTAGSPPFTLPESSTFPVPAATYSVTLKMVPRVPIAAQLMQGMCNQTNTIRFPEEILKEIPDVGTLDYLGYELSDPYFTCSGRKVFDITYSLGHRPSGDGPKRGWNAAYCTKKMAFRRIIVALLSGGNLFNIQTGAQMTTFPISDDENPDQSIRLAPKGANVYNFAELSNLFKFEGDRVNT